MIHHQNAVVDGGPPGDTVVTTFPHLFHDIGRSIATQKFVCVDQLIESRRAQCQPIIEGYLNEIVDATG